MEYPSGPHSNSGTQLQSPDQEDDTEEAPPRIGNVLDKLVLFSSIEARALETPSLSRRRAGEAKINKVRRTASFSAQPAAMMEQIDENPLIRTLERITQTQAQLNRSNGSSGGSGGQQKISQKEVVEVVGDRVEGGRDGGVGGKGSSPSRSNSTRAQADIIREQERLLEQARRNLANQKQQQRLDTRSDEAGNLMQYDAPAPAPHPALNSINPQSLSGPESASLLSPSDIMAKDRLGNPARLEITEDESDHESSIAASKSGINNSVLAPSSRIQAAVGERTSISPASNVGRASSFNGHFDFTKTPGSFLNRRKFSQQPPAATPPSSSSAPPHQKPEAPKLEFLSANVTRKFSAPEDNKAAEVRQARLDFFDKTPTNDAASKSLPRKQSQTSSHQPVTNMTPPSDKVKPTIPEDSRPVRSQDKAGPPAPKLPAKRSSTTAAEPYYAKPISPPRPVTPPRPCSPGTPPRPSSPLSRSGSCSPPPPRPSLPSAARDRRFNSLNRRDSVEVFNDSCSNLNFDRQIKNSSSKQQQQQQHRKPQQQQQSRIPQPRNNQSSRPLSSSSAQYSPRVGTRSTTPLYMFSADEGTPVIGRTALSRNFSAAAVSESDSDYPPFQMSREYMR